MTFPIADDYFCWCRVGISWDVSLEARPRPRSAKRTLIEKTRILQKQLLAVFICVIYLCAFESIMYKLKASDGSFLSDAHIVESSRLVCFVNLIYVRYMEACV